MILLETVECPADTKLDQLRINTTRTLSMDAGSRQSPDISSYFVRVISTRGPKCFTTFA